MKYSEVKLGSKTLVGMSKDRKEIKARVEGLSNPIVAHIMKLVLFPDNLAKTTWIIEIDSWLEQLNKLKMKPKKRQVDEKILVNLLITKQQKI